MTDRISVVEIGYYFGQPIDERFFGTMEEAKSYADFKNTHRRGAEGPTGGFFVCVNGKILEGQE